MKFRRSKYPLGQWVPGTRVIDGKPTPVFIRRTRRRGRNYYDVKIRKLPSREFRASSHNCPVCGNQPGSNSL